jgi:hypothetical protein
LRTICQNCAESIKMTVFCHQSAVKMHTLRPVVCKSRVPKMQGY